MSRGHRCHSSTAAAVPRDVDGHGRNNTKAFCAVIDTEIFHPNDTGHNLNKKGNLEDEKTHLDTKIACGHCGEVPFLGSIHCKCGKHMQHILDIRLKSTRASRLTRCYVSKSSHGDQSAPAGTTAAPGWRSRLLAHQKNITTAV